MGGERPNQVESTPYIGFDEACDLLESKPEEVKALIKKGELHAFRIGGEHLRLRGDQVSEVKARWRINRQLFPDRKGRESHILVLDRPAIIERIKDYIYFNDFYIACSVIFAALVTLILSSQ